MSKEDFTKAIKACEENGERLCYDAEACWNSPAGLALAILAQEEFAKAFMLNLVNEDIIPWTSGVKWSIRNHECKHLFVLIMEYLTTIDEQPSEWLKRLKSDERVEIPSHIRDAINIYRHELVRRKGERDTKWKWQEKEYYHKIPKRIGIDRAVDIKKQYSLYVEISDTGDVVNVPNATEKDVEKELERAREIRGIASGQVFNAMSCYDKIRDLLNWVFEEPKIISQNAKSYGVA